MWKNRLCYLIFMAVFAGFLFFFARPYLLAVLLGMAVLAGLLWLCLLHDAGCIMVEASLQSGGREGNEVPLTLEIQKKGILLAAGSVMAKVELHHTMYDIVEDKQLLLPLTGKKLSYDLPVETDCCGELSVACIHLELGDLLNLFRVRLKNFQEVRTMVYPRRVSLNVELSRDVVGSPKNDGFLQNRKGNDPREIYDLRDYVPGDDVRSIHWKLSGKLDRIVVKQASDPAHYEVLLMPDLGQLLKEDEVEKQQLNMAVALCASVGEELVLQGVAFHMAVLTKYGLELKEVRNEREFQETLSLWMSTALPKESGMGLRYFISEHLEQYFSKILILTSGRYQQELDYLSGRISLTVISAVDGTEFSHVKLNSTCSVEEIPTKQESREVYRVIC